MTYEHIPHDHLVNAETGDLVDAALTLTDWDLSQPEYGTAANVNGVRTERFTFSRRLDSHTIFATDLDYGVARRIPPWTGSDRDVVRACRRILRAAKIRAKEIGAIDVLTEMGQVAERRSDGDIVDVQAPALLRKVGRARRTVEGMPVWSSYATVGLTMDAAVGSLELHWPDVPRAVLREASMLQELVSKGVQPPELPGARPEAVEAGIIHSAAIGFHMDIVPAIRVIYVVDEPGVGRKPTLYLDRHGESVTRPRDITPAEPPRDARRRDED